MPTPTIPDGELFMNATLWTGNGSSQTISNGATGQNFTPDFVWIKSRSGANSHFLNNTIVGPVKTLISNSTGAEANETNGLTAFTSTGFTIGSDSSVNTNGGSYVGWQWKAGGTAVTNTAGSITSQVSANTTSGFSVVTYTGTGSAATIGHGLGAVPRMVIVKARNNARGWAVYHGSLANTQALVLNSTSAVQTQPNFWNSTTPTSTVFSVGTDDDTGFNGRTYVAYCWSQIAGYSAFGSYNSNASADGPFVYLGFRPRWVMIKKATGSVNANSGWYIYDTARGTINVMGPTLRADLSDAESTFNSIDFLSNGFKIRAVDIGINSSTSGDSYIYMAFAENPFKYANAR